jgi:Cutinase
VRGALAVVAVVGAAIPLAWAGNALQVSPAEARQHEPGSATSNCPAYLIIDSRGSGELPGAISRPGSRFFEEFQRLHPSEVVRVVANAYPAAGSWNIAGAVLKLPFGYHTSVVTGKTWLSGKIAAFERICPQTPMILTGYSQGAQVTADVYDGLRPGTRVLGAVLFGDPYFNSRDRIADRGDFKRGLDGVLGTRPIFELKGSVLSYCHQHDPVCQGPLSYVELARYRFSRHDNYDKLGEPEEAAQYFAPLLDCGDIAPGWIGKRWLVGIAGIRVRGVACNEVRQTIRELMTGPQKYRPRASWKGWVCGYRLTDEGLSDASCVRGETWLRFFYSAG